MGNLDGIRALVTGAGSGIGRGIALRLASGGSRVAVADINADRARETVKLITDAGGAAVAIVADLSKSADIDRMVAEAVGAWGGLDALVNNAGVASAGFLEMVSDEEIERVFAVNVYGVMRATRAAFPHLKASGRGRVVNLSSVEGIRGSGMLPVYSSTKAAVLGMTRSNACEFARYGITVNALCPGAIDTEMLAPLVADEAMMKKFLRSIPLHRLGKPEDIAAAVAFLVSAEASYITGNELVIDGGMTIKTM